MSLIVPPFQFANITDNLAAIPGTTNSQGVALNANANNVDSSPITVLTALGHDVHWLSFALGGFFSTSNDGQTLASLLVDPAGGTSWSSLIDYLTCGQTTFFANQGLIWYNFPLFIKAGSSIGAMARTKHTANLAGRILMNAMGNPTRPEAWWCGQKVEALGIDAANSKGTTITPGLNGAAGTWTNVGSPTTARYGAIQLGINGSDATALTQAYHFEMGFGGQALPGSPKRVVIQSTNEASQHFNGAMPVFCDVPAGTQMQARATGGPLNVEDFNVGIYGVI